MNGKSIRSVCQALMFSALFVVTTAGCAPVASPVSSLPVATVQAVATATPAPLPTATTASSPTAAAATSEMAYENVRLAYPAALAQDVRPETIPATEAGSMFGQPTPRTIRLTFVQDAAAGQGRVAGPDTVPALYVYDVAEYTALDGQYDGQIKQRVEALQALLAQRPTEIKEQVPVLPPINAVQQFRSQIHYVEFKDGRGVCFVTQYAQGPVPINNEELVYVFQGLTTDGKHYLAGFFPLTAPGLPDAATMDGKDLEALVARWQDYVAETTQSLNALPANQFSPSLTLLDEAMSSIEIQ